MKGWVYVITNKSMPGLSKVGYSTKDPELRAIELNHTGTPHPYIVEYEILVDHPRDIEQSAHRRLADKREAKEWFRCTPEEAISAIKSAYSGKYYIENYKRADRIKAEDAMRKQQAETERLRRLHEEKQNLDARIQKARNEVNNHYEKLLEQKAKRYEFWQYFLFFAFLTGIIVESLSTRPNTLATILISAVVSLFVSAFVKDKMEERARESLEYKALAAQRDRALTQVEQLTLQKK